MDTPLAVALIVNPHAGKGRARRAADDAIAELRMHGADVRVYAGESAVGARTLAEQALAQSPDVLAVVGGDGTLSGLAGALMKTDVPVALVPAGTGNDLARALGLPLHDAAAAARVALRGRARVIDVGEVHSAGGITPFLTVAALGFDAKVSDRTNRLRWPRGALRYYLALVVELFRLRPVRFRVAVDGAHPVSAPGTLIAVGNAASYGGGMPVCIGAAPDDGLLDVVHVAPLTRRRLLRLFPHLLRGSHLALPEVHHRRARTVDVSAPDLVVYADGERVGSDSCRITVRPAALRVLAGAD